VPVYWTHAVKHTHTTKEDYSMTYYESAENIVITHNRAIKEIKDHGLIDDLDMFYDELGKRDNYEAQQVLQWLGY
jgi:hypothetical protein